MEFAISDNVLENILRSCILEKTPNLNLDELAQRVIDNLNLNSTSPIMVDSIYVGPLNKSLGASIYRPLDKPPEAGRTIFIHRDGFFCPKFGMNYDNETVSFIENARANEKMIGFLEAVRYPYKFSSDKENITDVTEVCAYFDEPINAIQVVGKLSNPIPPEFKVTPRDNQGLRSLLLSTPLACLKDGVIRELYLDFIEKLTEIYKERKPSVRLINSHNQKIGRIVLYGKD